MSLYEELWQYSKNGRYPFHMPGHKRNDGFRKWQLPFSIDITEIEGFDDLHHPDGIIREACEKLSGIYGSEKSFFCVNGSTGGILASISAAIPLHGKIGLARNSHKSAYHAVYLRDLVPYYLMPEFEDGEYFCGQIKPQSVENMFYEDPAVKAVFITSPTYDGVLSDIQKISEIVHDHGAVLIVDEAHGAHLKFSDYFPCSAVSMGADIVIQSFHKTLPSLTQTAVVHVMTDRVDMRRLEQFLDIYQTTSPSYVLMASLDRCVQFLKEEGEYAFRKYTKLLDGARKDLMKGECLRLVVPENAFAYDRSKILLSDCTGQMDGYALAEKLRNSFGIEPEMAADHYVLLLSSVGDTQEGFECLRQAVSAIDEELTGNIGMISFKAGKKTDEAFWSSDLSLKYPCKEPENRKEEWRSDREFVLPKQKLRLSEAMEKETEKILLDHSEGYISAAFVSLFPPEIPLLVPGELISSRFIKNVRRYQDSGAKIHGLDEKESVIVVKG